MYVICLIPLPSLVTNRHRQNLVYRYDTNKSDDGVGGEEGTFCLCTLWCVEALTRAGQYDKSMLSRAVSMFDVRTRLVSRFGVEADVIGVGLPNVFEPRRLVHGGDLCRW
jgi:hypothetical protein